MTRRGGDAETRRARNRIGIPVSPCPRVPVSVLSPNCRIRPNAGVTAQAIALPSSPSSFSQGGRSPEPYLSLSPALGEGLGVRVA
jgi:hypothetical protein